MARVVVTGAASSLGRKVVTLLAARDDVDAVVTYATSIPPAQHATHDQRRVLADAVRRRMTEGGGSMRIDTRTGAFVCRGRTA